MRSDFRQSGFTRAATGHVVAPIPSFPICSEFYVNKLAGRLASQFYTLCQG